MKNRPMRLADTRQQGLAIITVLLIIALLVTLIGFLVERQHIVLSQVSNHNVHEHGYQMAMGAESWLLRFIEQDIDLKRDHWDEDWYKVGKEPAEEEGSSFSLDLSSQPEEKIAELEFRLGDLEVEIIDLQGRYNLNNLAIKGQPQVVEQQKRIFLNLLQMVGVEELDTRENLTGALIDWVDENDAERAYGVESSDYQTRKRPHFAADQYLSSVGELRFVKGFSPQIIKKLAPFVSALPGNGIKININTTSTEVLSSLSQAPITDPGSVEAFLAKREIPEGGSLEVTEAEDAVRGVSIVQNTQPVPDMMTTASDYFMLSVTVIIDSHKYRMNSIVKRSSDPDGSKVSIISRQNTLL